MSGRRPLGSNGCKEGTVLKTAGLPEVELYQLKTRWGQVWRYWLVSEDDKTFTVAFAGTTETLEKRMYSYKVIR